MMRTIHSFINLRTAPMSQSVLAPQVADLLDDSLHAVFARLCTERYGGPLSLQHVAAPGESPSTVRLQIERTGLPTLEAAFAVHLLGGNMYEIAGAIEDGPTRAFSHCLSDPAPLLAPKAPRLAHDVATFLLDALERRLGSDLLRAELRRRSAMSASSAA